MINEDGIGSSFRLARRKSYHELQSCVVGVDSQGNTTMEDETTAASELYEAGVQFMGVGEIMLQQGKHHEAMELYLSALENLENFVDEVPNHTNAEDAHAKIAQCDETLQEIDSARIAERVKDAETLCQEAELAATEKDFELAKQLYIEAVDVYMELEVEAESAEEKAQMSSGVMVLLSKAEKMKQFAEEHGQPIQASRTSTQSTASRGSEHQQVTSKLAPTPEGEEGGASGDASGPQTPRPLAQQIQATDMAGSDAADDDEDPLAALAEVFGSASSPAGFGREFSAVSGSPEETTAMSQNPIPAKGGNPQEIKLLQDAISELCGHPFSFEESTALTITNAANTHVISASVKQSLLTLLGYALPHVGPTAQLKSIRISCQELEVNRALEQSLSQGLNCLEKLVRLDLSYAGVGPTGCKALANALGDNQIIVTMNLSHNFIGDEGAAALADPFLKSSKAIRQIVLSNNGIGQFGAEALCYAMSRGCSLYQMDLRGNPIGCDVVDKLVVATKGIMAHVHISTDHRGRPGVCRGHPSSKYVEIHQPRASVDVHEAGGADNRVNTSGQSLGARLRKTLRRGTSPVGSPNARQQVSPLRTSYSVAANSVFRQVEAVMSDEIVGDYRATIAELLDRMTMTNVLVVGQTGTGKSSVINKAIGYQVTNSSTQSTKKAIQYRSRELSMTLWDTRALDSERGMSYEEHMKFLLEKLNTDEDPTKHIHCIWYVVDNPVWQAVDERLCKKLLGTYENMPFCVIINKADRMADSELELVKKHIGEAFRYNPNLLGVFTAICKTVELEKRLLEQEDVQDRAARARAQQMAVSTVKKLHLLPQCVRLSKDVLTEAQLGCIGNALKAALKSKETNAVEVIRAFHTKFEAANSSRFKSVLGRGKKYIHGQVAKLVVRLAHVWGIVRSDSDSHESDPTIGKEFLAAVGLDDDNQVDCATLGAIAVLWSINLKNYLLSCLEEAFEEKKPQQGSNSFVRVVDRTRAGTRHLVTISELFEKIGEEESGDADGSGHHSRRATKSQAFHALLKRAEASLTGSLNMGEEEEEDGLAGGENLDALHHLVNVVAQSKDTDVRDGFFSAFRYVSKKEPVEVLAAMREVFQFHAAKSSKSKTHSEASTQLCLTLVYWLDNYFGPDFVEQEYFSGKVLESEPTKKSVHELEAHGLPTKMAQLYMDFADRVEHAGLVGLSNDLREGMKRKIAEFLSTKAPGDLVFAHGITNPMKQYDPFLVAAHLSFHNFSVFQSMKTSDFYVSESAKRHALIHHANMVTYWIVKNIVQEVDLKARTSMLRKSVIVAKYLQSDRLRDFHGFMAVMTALQLSHVSRLKKAWAELEARDPQLYALYQGGMSTLAEPGNGMYQNVLDKLNDIQAPCVPFFGSFLTAIERARASGKGKTGDTPAGQAKINKEVYSQCQKMMKRIAPLQKGSHDWKSFNLAADLNRFVVEDVPTMFDTSSRKARNQLEDDLNKLSLISEPRAPTRRMTPSVDSSA